MDHEVRQRAAIYARISRDADDSRLGVERQREDCAALIERRGYLLAGVYEDNDLSAFTGRRRPEYERLVDDIRAGLIDVVTAWHPDRLHRSPKELEGLLDIADETGIRIETVTAGDLDLSTPTGRAVARTITAWARFESEHKAARIRRKHEELALAGMVSGGGLRPFGYEADRVTVRPDEAALIREASWRVMQGVGPNGIALDWNARGVPTPTGKSWRTSTVRLMLCRPRLAGIRSHKGESVGPAVWPAILDRATHERVRTILEDPGRGTGPAARTYLLTGLLFCGRCGQPMKGHRRRGVAGNHVPTYVCHDAPGDGGCGRTKVVAGPLDELVVSMTLEALAGPALASAIAARSGGTSAGLAGEISAAEDRLKELAAAFGRGDISRAEWLAARDGAEKARRAARGRLVATTRSAALADVAALDAETLRTRWDTMTRDRRRALLAAVLERIEVGPGRRGVNRFEPSRVTVRWRA